MKFFLLLLFSLLVTIASAQFADPAYYLIDSLDKNALDKSDQRNIDSLLKIYHNSKTDTLKFQVLSKLTGLNDVKTWYRYNRRLIADLNKILLKKHPPAEEKFYQHKLANAYYNMNYYFSQVNLEDTAIHYLRLSVEPYRKAGDAEGLGDVYNSIGVYYSRTGNYNQALKFYHQAIPIFESVNSKKGIARSYISIGTAYRDINEFPKALENCKHALQIYEELKLKSYYPEVWNHLGIIYKWSGDTVNAKAAYEKSYKFAREVKDQFATASALLNLGIIFQDEKKFDAAIGNYKESLLLFKKINNSNGVCYVLNSLAITHNRMNQPDKALGYALEAYRLASELQYPETLINSVQALYETYEKSGKYKEAFAFQQRYFVLKDSINNAESQKAALKTQLEFENEKKVLGLKKEQESKNLLAAEEKKQHIILIFASVVCLVILIVFFIFLYKRFKITARQKTIIEKQNHIVTEKNREILDSILYAKRLQEAILPAEKEVKRFLPDSFVLYKPKDIVAGDFYWLHAVNSDHILFAVADSTGHGVPGALVSVVCSNALNRSAAEFGLTRPGEILDKTRELILETFEKSDKDVKDGMDISLISLRNYNGKKIIEWSGANNPLWYFRNKTFHEIKGDKQPVGKTDHGKPFTTHSFELQSGDSVYLFTDGFADQFGGPSGKKFKYKPFSELLASVQLLPPSEQERQLFDSLENWKAGLEQVDDICVAGIKI